jgi:Tol biopolymer transport system component
MYRTRFRLANAFLAAVAVGSGLALVLLLRAGGPGLPPLGGCGGPPVTWTERSVPARPTPTGLLALRLSDRTVTTLVPGRPGRLDHPAFAPDGRRLAFVADSNGILARLAVCDLERAAASRLRLSVPAGDFPLDWTPDGRTILFLGGDLLGYGADQRPFLVDVDSGRLEPLGANSDWYYNAAALSPDGNRLAMLLQLRYPGSQEPQRLVLVDGSGAFERLVGSRQVAQIDALSWSPDARRIAFSAYRNDDHGDLYEVRLETRRVRKVIASSAGERDPEWSPDGNWIAFVRSPPRRPRESSIWVVRSDGRDARRISWGRRDVAPTWSPDGRTIAFVRR